MKKHPKTQESVASSYNRILLSIHELLDHGCITCHFNVFETLLEFNESKRINMIYMNQQSKDNKKTAGTPHITLQELVPCKFGKPFPLWPIFPRNKSERM